jgi:hypothetical protein
MISQDEAKTMHRKSLPGAGVLSFRQKINTTANRYSGNGKSNKILQALSKEQYSPKRFNFLKLKDAADASCFTSLKFSRSFNLDQSILSASFET